MDKVILHSDLNNFYASVESVNHPEYKDIPIAVCGNPKNRHGIVLAKNNLAKKYGVKTGEPIWESLLKCRNLVIVPPHFDQYSYYSKLIRDIYYEFTDRIETFGLDECWLDVTGSQKLFGNGQSIANKIRETVKERTGLTVSIGVSFSKVFAKLGSDMKKPDATTIISRDNYKNLVWPLPVSEMLFIGKNTTEKLKSLNIFTIGDLANYNPTLLKKKFGVIGIKMHNDANGIEEGEILKFNQTTPIKSVGNGMTTKRDIQSNEDARTVIYYLSETVATRLREYGYMANGIGVTFRSNDLNSFTRQKILHHPTISADEISKACYQCFIENYDFNKNLPIRTLTISTFDLISLNDSLQSNIFNDTIKEQKKFGNSLDSIRKKFGDSAVTKAAFIDNTLLGTTEKEDDDILPFQRGNREKHSNNE